LSRGWWSSGRSWRDGKRGDLPSTDPLANALGVLPSGGENIHISR
jgi:hypothetical protein